MILWEDLLATIKNKNLVPLIMLSLHMISFKKISHFIVKPESYLSDHCQIVT